MALCRAMSSCTKRLRLAQVTCRAKRLPPRRFFVLDAAWARSLLEPPSEALTISHHFACPVIFAWSRRQFMARLCQIIFIDVSGQKSLFKGR